MLIRLIKRELKSSPRFIFFFILNLAIGLMGLSAIEILKTSFDSQLKERSKSISGSDLSIGARRKIEDKHVKIVKENLDFSDHSLVLSMFSMVRKEDKSKLINLRVIEDNFPFYGKIVLEDDQSLRNIEKNHVYAYPELKFQLGLTLGSTLKIGSGTFIVKGFIKDDAQQNLQMGALAPRMYISSAGLKLSGLNQAGSTISYTHHFKLRNAKIDQEKLREKITKALDEPSIRVNTPKTSSQQVGRVLGYLNDFLGLVSLAGLFLATFGLVYLFRGFLHGRRKEIAIMKFLGLKKSQVQKVYFGELFFLGTIGSLLGVILGTVLSLILSTFIANALAIEIPVSLFNLQSLVVFLIGIMATLTIAPALVIPYTNIDHKVLFSFDEQMSSSLKDKLLYLPVLLFYWPLAIYLAHSFLIGSLFIGIIFLFVLLAFPLGATILSKLSHIQWRGSLAKKLSLKYLIRHKISTLFIFCSLTLSTLFIALIPLIRTNLQEEISPSSSRSPVFFLFDIQEDQKENLLELLKKLSLEDLNTSPMVRSRLLEINGEPLKTSTEQALTREEQRAIRMRNRGINLSYRGYLDASESLVRGRLPKAVKEFNLEEPAEITLERRYAKRLGVDLGDTLLFDVLDLPIKAKIVGIRNVKWTSFIPNFFINFGEGVLELAPKSYLMAVTAKDTVDLNQAQTEISNLFPNVSIIDVKRVIEKISSIISSMAQILVVMAILTLLVGLLVIYSLINHQFKLRQKDIHLLKVLGIQSKDIEKSLTIEILILSATSLFVGILIAESVAFFLSKIVFDTIPTVGSLSSLGIFFLTLGFIYLISRMIIRSVSRKKPSEIFAEID
ncbi:FtsX-like permease family protein [Halobacteriovorax sp. GB3]|uniref:ABC transporter permease n=1 Tax=Halobacteriovorax sp. GB3 TaxID=2719615 RepID=UPI0023630EEA|nr:FtsX-like permease family protein [Halobacteriovorax sp. GB3]MDD0851790.1 FtsX-like permease family protein [Halobacteriovorax sp. GB3]